MRIALDCRYIRERPSGIGAYVQALVDRLPQLAPEDAFDLWTSPRARSPLTLARNTVHHVVRAPANSLRTLLVPQSLAPLDGVDVFHATFNLLGRSIPCASVVTVHDLMWLLHPSLCEGKSLATPFQTAFYRDGIMRALRKADRIVAITRATADSVASVAAEAVPRIRVIHHGIEPRFAPPDDPPSAQERVTHLLRFDSPYFLVVGQNAPSKYHRGVLEAFARAACRHRARVVFLQRLYARGRWWVLGGEGLDVVAHRLGVDDRVTWLPSLSDEQVVELLQCALALVQFSRFEGFGMPVLEALACGTPVIASDIAPLCEVTGGAAVHVPLRVDALAKAMDRVFGEPSLRRELSERGVERSRAFSWRRCAELHLEVYHDAARANPRRT